MNKSKQTKLNLIPKKLICLIGHRETSTTSLRLRVVASTLAFFLMSYQVKEIFNFYFFTMPFFNVLRKISLFENQKLKIVLPFPVQVWIFPNMPSFQDSGFMLINPGLRLAKLAFDLGCDTSAFQALLFPWPERPKYHSPGRRRALRAVGLG